VHVNNNISESVLWYGWYMKVIFVVLKSDDGAFEQVDHNPMFFDNIMFLLAKQDSELYRVIVCNIINLT